MPAVKSITLQSLVRKSLNAYALKALIRSTGAELHRLGRSRHWQLNATFEQIHQIIEKISASQQPSWQWLTTLLIKQQQQLSYQELLSIARSKPDITLNELLARTNCSIALARKVMDDIEWHND